MRRLLLLAMLFSLVAATLYPVIAGRQVTAQQPDFADLVTIYGEDDSIFGLVSVSGLYDPFEVIEAGNDPGPGNHFVLIEAGFFNTGDQPMPFDPDGLLLVDSNGFVYSRTMINNLTAESTNYFQQAGTVEAGTEFYGDNAYAIPDGTVIDRIVYVTDLHHLTAVDTRSSTVDTGTAVAVSDTGGGEIGEVTVNAITDPFEAVDPSNAPADGNRYVAVDLTISNASAQPLPLTASDIRAIDDLGRQVIPTAVALADPAFALLADASLEPGGTVQGVVVYQVPAANVITQVLFSDGGTRSLVLADIASAGSLTDATGGCRDFANWAFDTLGRAGSVGTFAQNLSTVTSAEALDPGMVRLFASQAASNLEDQRKVVPPPAVEAVNTYFTEEVIGLIAGLLDRLATALETGDLATAQQALSEISATTQLFNPGAEGDLALQELQAACPEEWQEFITQGG